MNSRQKEFMQYQLDSEKEVLEQLKKHYQRAFDDITRKIRILQSDELTQSKVYRIEYQKALKMQVEATLKKLLSDEYTTIQQFLSDSYTDAFVGTVYDMFGQGVPLILPIDKNEAVKAVMTESQLDKNLYESLGVDISKLQTTIRSEITRGIAAGLPHTDIARNIANNSKIALSRAKTIVRTESHRIQQAAKLDAQHKAVSKGANVVKQWNSTLDGNTRPTHRRLDGKLAEVDDYFEMDGKKAMYPGGFGDPAEDCNCRCQLLQRSRLALDEDELKTLQERAKYFGLLEEDSKEFGHDKARLVFSDFKKKYLKASEKVAETIEKNGKSGIIKENKIGVQFFANKGILKQRNAGLKKSIESWKDRIDEHTAWIDNPELHDATWNEKTEKHKAGLIKHWRHEIDIFKRNIQEAEDELKKRGVHDDG